MSSLIKLTIPDRKEWVKKLHKFGDHPSVLRIQNSKLISTKTPIKKNVDHFTRLGQSASHFDFKIKEEKFSKIINQLKKPIISNRTNADPRSFYTYKNKYLVNKNFTLGVTSVDENEWHLIQTTEVPLIFYHLKNCNAEEGTLKPEYENNSTKFVLQPNRTYIIKPRKKYIIVSTAKTYFSFKKIPVNTLLNLKISKIKFPLVKWKNFEREGIFEDTLNGK